LSDQIRDAIEEIKQLQRIGGSSTSRANDLDKKKWLQKYVEVAELLGVGLTVEHLLPALTEFVSFIKCNFILNSSNKMRLQDVTKDSSSKYCLN
jgi:hypothetical protein